MGGHPAGAGLVLYSHGDEESCEEGESMLAGVQTGGGEEGGDEGKLRADSGGALEGDAAGDATDSRGLEAGETGQGKSEAEFQMMPHSCAMGPRMNGASGLSII